MTSPLRLLPLGTNGYFPTQGRQTMSYLLVATGAASSAGSGAGSSAGSRAALVLDAGTGLGRLAEPELAELLAPIERLDILLTHYHLDHVVGLSFLPGIWSGRAVRIFA
ncbi:MAG: MBL fold metallo-hydrolase, partial [Myxococcota bacterium]